MPNSTSNADRRSNRGSRFFSNSGFGSGVKENFREFFRAGVSGGRETGLGHKWDAGFGDFRQNLRELFHYPDMSATANGEAIPEIWSKNSELTRVQALSVAIHVTALALIIAPFWGNFHGPANAKRNPLQPALGLQKYHLSMLSSAKPGGGGGAGHEKFAATHGKIPPFAKVQYVAPTSHPVMDLKLTMAPTLIANEPVNLPNVNAQNWGDPLSSLLGNSAGAGGRDGIGDGGGDGYGPGSGSGVGDPRSGTGGYGNPSCLYCPAAQYSEEAVKSKHQGIVLVDALITADGRASGIRVIKGLGMGLDENAVAAVKTWRFKPAIGPDGKPASVEQMIEVEFRLI
jgi:protein TonB